MASYRDVGPLQSDNLDVGPLQSPHSVTLSLSLSDSLTFFDGFELLGLDIVQIQILTTDYLYFSDFQALFTVQPATETLSDTLSFSDAEVLWLVIGLSFSDALVILDNYNPVDGGNSSDTITFVDSYMATLGLSILALDILAFLDGYNVLDINGGTNIDLPHIADNLAFVDTSVVSVFVSESFSDTVSFTDTVANQMSVAISRSDTITFIDQANLGNPSPPKSASDFINFSDSFSLFSAQFLGFADSFALTDAVLTGMGDRVFTDSFSFSDSVSVALLNNLVNETFSEDLTILDGVQVLLVAQSSGTNIYDLISLSDAVTVSLQTYLNDYIREYLNDPRNL